MSSTRSFFRNVRHSLFSAGIAFVLVACGGGGAQVQQGDTLGKVLGLIAASTAADSDGDGLPDDVEAYLGTDPHERDSDHDGIPDFVEVFGTGDVNEASLISDRNQNGIVAALDPDDDADGIVDGQQLDSDGDGIPDYLEYYGFTYNPVTGKYAAWDGDYSKPYYKTDPHQKSTDQDPFDDGVEISGVNMDPSVADPGTLPMVPAYPDIVVRLEGYTVTLNQELTWTQGSSLSKGTTWDRTAEASDSNTSEANWEAGISTKVSYGSEFGGETELHFNYGRKNSSTSGTSNSVSTGGSILNEQNWTTASTQNPVDAARIKLFLKVQNRGTAIASNLKPAFTLRIGGRNVATIEAGGTQVNLLEPGGVYPSTAGVYWVVDSSASGQPISLTLSELKALESGAPLSLTLTQMSADVMLRNPKSGVYESAGDWNEYMARVRAVSANLFFDKGDGNTVRALVYAGGSATAPVITLGDALVWSMKGRQDPATHEVFISYFDELSSSVREASLTGWHLAVDADTLKANGFPDKDSLPPGFNIATLRLNPKSFVVAKAPRAQAQADRPFPSIVSAYYDPSTGGINAVVSDYNGIKSVEFVDKDGNVRAMKADLPDSSFYVYVPAQDTVNYPNGYQFTSAEQVRVTNFNNQSSSKNFLGLYTPPEIKAPRIASVLVDLALHRIYAHVESDVPLYEAPAFVRIYGAVFKPDLGFGDGYCQMQRVSNWFEDPTGWVCELNANWTEFSNISGSRVVAYAKADLFSIRAITAADEFQQITGSGRLATTSGALSTGIFPWQISPWEVVDYIDLDTSSVAYYAGPPLPALGPLAPGVADAWFKITAGPVLNVNFAVAGLYVGKDGSTGVDFNRLTPSDIQGMNLKPGLTSTLIYKNDDNVFVYRTQDGRYGKLRIKCDTWWSGASSYRNYNFFAATVGSGEYEFVTFK